MRGWLITLLLGGQTVVMTWADLAEMLGDPYRSGPLPAGLRAVDELGPARAGEVALSYADTRVGNAAARWQVSASGLIEDGRRLCVLNPRAAADLFHLLTLARPEEPVPVAAGSAIARLRLLGGCELTVDGQPVSVRRTAGLQVLAYLGLHPGGASGHELTAAIWPGLRPATIANRLHVTVSELRKDLISRTAIELLRHEDGRYVLTGAVDVDVHGLRAAIAGLQQAITVGERGRAQRAVVDAYAGELLFGCDWPWAIPARESLRRQVLTAYVDLADRAEPPESVELLRAAVSVDPFNEDVRSRIAAVQRPRRPRPHA